MTKHMLQIWSIFLCVISQVRKFFNLCFKWTSGGFPSMKSSNIRVGFTESFWDSAPLEERDSPANVNQGNSRTPADWRNSPAAMPDYKKIKYRVPEYNFSVWSRFGLKIGARKNENIFSVADSVQITHERKISSFVHTGFSHLPHYFPDHAPLGTKTLNQTNNNINGQKDPPKQMNNSLSPSNKNLSSLQRDYKPTQIKL